MTRLACFPSIRNEDFSLTFLYCTICSAVGNLPAPGPHFPSLCRDAWVGLWGEVGQTRSIMCVCVCDAQILHKLRGSTTKAYYYAAEPCAHMF